MLQADPPANTHTAKTTWSGFLTLLPFLLLASAAFLVFSETTDDPFITFRYAANLLAGKGAVFNPGERVEGFTSPLHLLLSAALLKLLPGIGILFKAKLLSLVFGALILMQVRPVAKLVGLTPGETILTQILLAVNVNFAIAAINGLETTLFGWLLLVFVQRFLWERRAQSGVGSALLLFLALLARPESLLVFVGVLAVRFLWMRRGEISAGMLWSWAAIFVGLTALLVALRLAYYGQPLPNTYYAKALPIRDALISGIKYLLHPLSPALELMNLKQMKMLFALLLGLGFWSLVILGAIRLPRRSGRLTLLAILSALVLFILRSGGDWMYGWRFMISALPLLTMAQCFGLRVLVHRFEKQRAPEAPKRSSVATRTLFQGAAIGLCLLAHLTAQHRAWSQSGYATQDAVLLSKAYEGKGIQTLWIKTGDYLQAHFPPSISVAYSEVGYAAYINPDMRFTDTRGLTDFEIARLTGAKKSVTGVFDENWFRPEGSLFAVLKRRAPDVIIALEPAEEQSVVLDSYRLRKMFHSTWDNKYPISASVYVREGREKERKE